MRRSYEERAMDFIAQVFPYLNDLSCVWQTMQDVKLFNAAHNRKVEVRHGTARIALLTSDYVIKWDYDPEEADAIGGCENEVYLYNLAKAEGFAYLFAEITRTIYEGHYFYIMPRIPNISIDHDDAWEYMTEEEYAWCENHYLVDLHGRNFGLVKNKPVIVDYAFQEDRVDLHEEEEVSES